MRVRLTLVHHTWLRWSRGKMWQLLITFSDTEPLTGLDVVLCVWTHRAAIDQGFDVRVGLIAQLLVVGTQEVQRPLVVVLGALVGPGHGAVAVVGEVLTDLDAQEAQEAQLDHAHGITVGVDVGELGGGWERRGEDLMIRQQAEKCKSKRKGCKQTRERRLNRSRTKILNF